MNPITFFAPPSLVSKLSSEMLFRRRLHKAEKHAEGLAEKALQAQSRREQRARDEAAAAQK